MVILVLYSIILTLYLSLDPILDDLSCRCNQMKDIFFFTLLEVFTFVVLIMSSVQLQINVKVSIENQSTMNIYWPLKTISVLVDFIIDYIVSKRKINEKSYLETLETSKEKKGNIHIFIIVIRMRWKVWNQLQWELPHRILWNTMPGEMFL